MLTPEEKQKRIESLNRAIDEMLEELPEIHIRYIVKAEVHQFYGLTEIMQEEWNTMAAGYDEVREGTRRAAKIIALPPRKFRAFLQEKIESRMQKLLPGYTAKEFVALLEKCRRICRAQLEAADSIEEANNMLRRLAAVQHACLNSRYYQQAPDLDENGRLVEDPALFL